MSRLISVSDEVYETLKKRKNNHSFTKAIKELIESSKGGDVMRFAGAFKGDKEFADAMKEMRKRRKDFKLKRVKL